MKTPSPVSRGALVVRRVRVRTPAAAVCRATHSTAAEERTAVCPLPAVQMPAADTGEWMCLIHLNGKFLIRV